MDAHQRGHLPVQQTCPPSRSCCEGGPRTPLHAYPATPVLHRACGPRLRVQSFPPPSAWNRRLRPGLIADALHTGALVRVESAGWSGLVGATRPARMAGPYGWDTNCTGTACARDGGITGM